MQSIYIYATIYATVEIKSLSKFLRNFSVHIYVFVLDWWLIQFLVYHSTQ
jgi:hypothetical protein